MKEERMSDMFLKTPAPKSVRQGVFAGNPEANQGTALLPSDYMGFHPKDLQQYAKDFKKALKTDFDRPKRRVTTDTKATVFGVRDTGNGKWSFYCQINICYIYERYWDADKEYNPKGAASRYIAEGYYWIPATVTKFYPGGGHSVTRQNVSRIL